jgi:hypothetical protein
MTEARITDLRMQLRDVGSNQWGVVAAMQLKTEVSWSRVITKIGVAAHLAKVSSGSELDHIEESGH